MSFPHPPCPQHSDTRSRPSNPSLPVSVPHCVNQWLSALNLHSALQQAELLCQTLDQYNHERLSPTTRMVLMELLRPAVFQACQQIERQYVIDGVDGELTLRSAARLMQLLHVHLRCGYQMVALAKEPLAPQQRARALQRCMRSAKEVQIYATLHYRLPPPGLWLKAHQLFQTAVQLELTDIGVTDSTLQGAERQTIAQAYTDNLLLALIQPLRLPRSQIRILADQLSRLAPAIAILPATPGSRLSVATDLDQPFNNLSCATLRSTLALDTDSLMDALGSVGGMVEDAMLQGLRMTLNGRLPPRIVPAPIGKTVEVVLDICQLRKHVNNSYPGSQSLPSTLSCKNSQPGKDKVAGCTCSSAKRQRSEAPPLPTRYNAQLLSNKGEGICLQWPRAANDRLHTGMLLALRTSPTAPWRIERLACAMYDGQGQMIVTLGG